MLRDSSKFNSPIPFTNLKPAEDRMIIFSFLAKFHQSKKGAACYRSHGFLWQLYISMTDVCSSLLESRSFCRAHMKIKDFYLSPLPQNIYLLSSGEIERSHGLNIWQLTCDAYQCVPFAINVTSDINRILQCLHNSSFQTEIDRSNSTWIRWKKYSQEGGIARKMALHGSIQTEHEPWRSIDSKTFLIQIGPPILKPRYMCLDLILGLLLLLNAVQSIMIKSIQSHKAEENISSSCLET